MTKRRKMASAGAVLALVAGTMGLAACGDDSEDSGDSGGASTAAAPTVDGPTLPQIGDGITIGFASLGCENQTVCAVNNGFKAAAEAMGAEAIVLESNASDPNTISKTISQMDQLIAEDVDAIAFWPLDPAALNAPVDRAEAAGIPVFAHDLYGDPRGKVISSVTEGRALKAKQSAQLICEKLTPDGGQVLYGNFPAPAPTLLFLRDQTKEYLSQCETADLEFAGEFFNKNDQVDGGRTGAEAALQKYPDAKAVANYNDPTAIGTSIAAEALGRDDLWIDGYNLAPDGVEALERGQIDASWDYRAPEVGQALAQVMVEYAAGEQTSPPKIIMIWPKGYTPETISTEYTPVDERIEQIRAGANLVAADPDYVTEGDTVPEPPDLPLPPIQ